MKSDADAFTHILAALHEALLDDPQWPATSALLDAACGATGNALVVGSGPPDDVRAHFVGLYHWGARRADLERDYLSRSHFLPEGRDLKRRPAKLDPVHQGPRRPLPGRVARLSAAPTTIFGWLQYSSHLGGTLATE